MIRPAKERDIPQIAGIDQTAVSDEELVGYGPPSRKRVLADTDRLRAAWVGGTVEGRQVYVFEDNGCILGFMLIGVAPDAIELDDITVAPDHQRRRIGTSMVEFVENLAVDLGKQCVTLGTTRNTKTRVPWKSYDFWLKRGYTVENEIETEEGKEYGFTEIRFRKNVRG